jgi:CSLREA domain-containing protein
MRPADFAAIANAAGGDGSDIGAVEVAAPQSGPSFTVTVATDEDDGTCGPDHCSLREAINAVNGDGVASTITFAARNAE